MRACISSNVLSVSEVQPTGLDLGEVPKALSQIRSVRRRPIRTKFPHPLSSQNPYPL